MENNFFILIFVTVLAFALHSSLLTKYVRKYDGLLITVYRNGSFLITMLPLLFFTSFNQIISILNHLPTLFIASFCALVAYFTRLQALKNLPFGIGATLRQAFYIFFSFALGFLLLNETYIRSDIILCAIIVGACFFLTKTNVDTTHLKNANKTYGYILLLISGLFHTLAFLFFTILTRETNPFVATYFWESLIGIFAIIAILINNGRYNISKLKVIPIKDILLIVSISSLTIIATLSYSFAIKIGDFAIANALMSATLLFQCIFGYLLFKEKLNIRQIIGIGGILLCIILLRII